MALSLKDFCKRVSAGYYSYRDLNGQMRLGRGGGVNKKPKTPRPNITPVATGRRDGPKQRDIIEISMVVKPALAAENIQLSLDVLPVRTTREVGLSFRKLTL